MVPKDTSFQKSILFMFSVFVICSCASRNVVQKSSRLRPLPAEQCLEGATRSGFVSPTVIGDVSCVRQIQTCVSGEWQGPMLFENCESSTKSCGGQPHGSAITGYLNPTSPAGNPCIPVTKTCLDGNWSGPEVFPSCTEL